MKKQPNKEKKEEEEALILFPLWLQLGVPGGGPGQL